MWVREQVEGWKKVTDAVHREGGYIYSQVSRILFDRVKILN
jgi:2,4-dienoyl-CoA reductase-like NADH-dependent reductase (Old Yellow Enzyme family)